MLNKRDFLKSSVITVTSALLAQSNLLQAKPNVEHKDSRQNDDPSMPTIDVVIYDQRFDDSVTFAAVLNELGTMQFPVAPDVGQLWFNILAPRIKSRPLRLAGLTQQSDLFVTQTLARDWGLKLTYCGHHDCQLRQTLNHQLTIEKKCRGIIDFLAAAGQEWPNVLALTLSQLDFAKLAKNTERVDTTTPRGMDNPGSLVSWVIG